MEKRPRRLPIALLILPLLAVCTLASCACWWLTIGGTPLVQAKRDVANGSLVGLSRDEVHVRWDDFYSESWDIDEMSHEYHTYQESFEELASQIKEHGEPEYVDYHYLGVSNMDDWYLMVVYDRTDTAIAARVVLI